MKIPGSEIDFAPAKTEVSELEHTEKETSVGKFYVTQSDWRWEVCLIENCVRFG